VITLRNHLKVYRAKHNLTQQELAGRVGVTRKTINVIEAGNYSPSVALALNLAKSSDRGGTSII
jgi:putative transcriptional regulator